jgi:hypothetical protein
MGLDPMVTNFGIVPGIVLTQQQQTASDAVFKTAALSLEDSGSSTIPFPSLYGLFSHFLAVCLYTCCAALL